MHKATIDFSCTGCGLCCKNITDIDALKPFDLGNGVCKNLNTKGNFCKIYEIRPEVCRVADMYEKYYKKQYSREDFYNLNAKICNALQEKNDLNIKFRLRL